MKKAKVRKIRLAHFILMSIVLILVLFLAGIYIEKKVTAVNEDVAGESTPAVAPKEVVVKDIRVNEDESSLSFLLINYKKISVKCSATVVVSDSEVVSESSQIFQTIDKPMGIIRAGQSKKGEIRGFEMPNGQSWFNVFANCTELR